MSISIGNQFSGVKRVSSEEMQARRDKNLCYYCDEIYHRGHVCTKRQLYLLMGDEGEENEFKEEGEHEIQFNKEGTEEMAISIHALMGSNNPQTITLLGTVNRNTLMILVDSGSTHNFLDPNTAQKLGCHIQPTNPIKVVVAKE